MTQMEIMTEQFSYIKSMKDEIAIIKIDVQINFEKNVLNFFKNKGFQFEKCEAETYGYPPTFQDYELKNKVRPAFAHDFGNNIYTYYPPTFRINGWNFVVRFDSWKDTNTNWTKVYWHPDEITLEEFYEKKLKKTFKLL